MLNFAVYSRVTFAQILSFREIVQADNASAARALFLKSRRRRHRDMILGVKAFDRTSKRCIGLGRWLA